MQTAEQAKDTVIALRVIIKENHWTTSLEAPTAGW